jgi:hypothetical protein
MARRRIGKKTTVFLAERTGSSVRHGFYCSVGILLATLWTAVGMAIAFFHGQFKEFVDEWIRLQGFFLVAIGTWLTLISRSNALRQRVTAVVVDGVKAPNGIGSWRLRLAVQLGVGAIGTTSLILLGFNARGILLMFMWFTCACICFAAGVVTRHALDIILVVHRLQRTEVKVSRYSPARTESIKDLVVYVSTFGLLLTVGYGFAFAATIQGTWGGRPSYVAAVQVFWPIIYVPACSVALLYPHLVIHRIIKREKERLLLGYQHQIDRILTDYSSLSREDVAETNSLAELFERINATPNYVMDFGIAFRTVLPLAINIASLVVKLTIHGS